MDTKKQQKLFDSTVVDQNALSYREEGSFQLFSTTTVVVVVLIVLIAFAMGAVVKSKAKDSGDAQAGGDKKE